MTRHPRIRRGGIAVWALFALPVILLLLILAVSTSSISLLTEEGRRTADACAHAGAESLVGDDLLVARLTGSGRGLGPAFDRAHAVACRACEANPIFGQAVLPDRNHDGRHDGEFVFGTVPRFGYQAAFYPTHPDHTHKVNAVRVRLERRGKDRLKLPGGHRQELVVTATAMLDDAVAGFRPVGDEGCIPVVPLGLAQDEWVDQVQCDGGKLPDMEFRLTAGPTGSRKKEHQPTAHPLTVGTRSVGELAAQVRDGVRRDEYARFADQFGPFELDEEHGRLAVPADRYCGPAVDPLRAALEALRQSGEARVWPVIGGFDREANGGAWVVGFVAARVISVSDAAPPDEGGGDDRPDDRGGNGGGNGDGGGDGKPKRPWVRLVVRPTMIGTPTAVTRPTAPANPFVCTVRLLTAEGPGPRPGEGSER